MVRTVAVERRPAALSPCDFGAQFLRPGVPVLVEGGVAEWPAAKKWSLDYLAATVGNHDAFVRKNTSSAEYKIGRRYLVERMKFAQYVEWIQTGNPVARDYYLAVQNLKQAYPEIAADVPLPPYVGKLHAGPYLWIASPGHYEYTHIDPDDNFLAIVSGLKRVRMFAPTDFHRLYPNPLGSKGRTIQAQVDLDAPDDSRFPLFADAVCYECDVRAGDLLFIPAFFWHQVTTVEVTISVNMFFGDAGTHDYLAKCVREPRWTPFSYWMSNVIEQNRPLASFAAVCADLRRALAQFLFKQYHEQATDDELDALVALVQQRCEGDDAWRRGMEMSAAVQARKHPPQLKIRGLLWRDSSKDGADSGEEAPAM